MSEIGGFYTKLIHQLSTELYYHLYVYVECMYPVVCIYIYI